MIKHKNSRYTYDPNTFEYVDTGVCECEKCVAQRAQEKRNADAKAKLPELIAAKERVAEFEQEYGPVEAGTHMFSTFATKAGEAPMRSQKARGLAAAKSAVAYKGPYWLKAAKIEAILPHQGRVMEQLPYPLFARPCPIRPRHGFVESRVVKNAGEVLGVLCETLKADAFGEVMLMKPLTGHASAIATDSGVVWGKGNDGVTSGKGEQYLLPVPKPEKTLTKCMQGRSYIYETDIKGSVYIEAVEDKGRPYIVQVRDGPAGTPVGGDYVPRKDYKITRVITLNQSASGDNPDWPDLMEWEKTILKAGEGTVIYMPKGSLTSHYAVHALASKLAVITGDLAPKEGDTLQPANDQPAALKKADYVTMAKVINKRIPGAKYSRAGYAVGVLHALSAWGNEPHLLELRMTGACMMARLLVSACVGEARHFYSCGPGALNKKMKSALPWKKILGGKELKGTVKHVEGPQRSVVLEKVYRYSIKTLSGMAFRARKDFLGDWGNGEVEFDRFGRECEGNGSSFGGKNWAKSAKVALDLCEAILAFQRTPTEKRWLKVLMCYNNGVAAAHNGGRLLDKWAEWDEINTCCQTPQFGLLSPQAMYVCTGVKPSTESLSKEYSWIDNILGSSRLTKKNKSKGKGKGKKSKINTIEQSDAFIAGFIKEPWTPVQAEFPVEHISWTLPATETNAANAKGAK